MFMLADTNVSYTFHIITFLSYYPLILLISPPSSPNRGNELFTYQGDQTVCFSSAYFFSGSHPPVGVKESHYQASRSVPPHWQSSCLHTAHFNAILRLLLAIFYLITSFSRLEWRCYTKCLPGLIYGIFAERT